MFMTFWRTYSPVHVKSQAASTKVFAVLIVLRLKVVVLEPLGILSMLAIVALTDVCPHVTLQVGVLEKTPPEILAMYRPVLERVIDEKPPD